MELKRLDPSLRRNLKDLLEGYVEHCQVSHHLMARIDFPIYFHGFKFGAPIFTHSAPGQEGVRRRVIGLLGVNTPDSQVSSEILLQLIEILVQRPEVGEGSILRILPVANPVALELGEHAPHLSDWPILEHMIGKFQEQSTEGVLEVVVTDGGYALEGNVSSSLFQALDEVRAEVPKDAGRSRVLVPDRILLSPVSATEPWRLKLSVPLFWTEAPEVHAVARFISRLIRSYSSLQNPVPERSSLI